MKNPDAALYQKESAPHGLALTESQKDSVRNITLGIEEVDETVRSFALEDVITTLENGHPLNRLIEEGGNVEGYIACEDFVSHEAYIKYLGTNKATGRNLLREIPAFLEYAKSKGYTKLNFHGWNNRLNKILTRYGFERIRTDNFMDQGIDFYEKVLVEEKTQEEIEQERIKAFEQKYINKVYQDYEQTLKKFSLNTLEEKKNAINATFRILDRRLSAATFADEDFIYGERQKAILKLKLARHFQNSKSIGTDTLGDALIESPKFMNTDKGSLHKLFEMHQDKTVQKIAEMRKKRAEMTGEGYNPYEALFTTKSGNYYIARLLSMPHLEEESEYMKHCVGTSDSYISKIIRGEVEILSFRNVPKINPDTNKFEGDTPVMTIEYNLKTKTIQQMKKSNDEYLTEYDPYYEDVIDALKQLRSTPTDTGELRNFESISGSELQNIDVQDGHILTDKGQISLAEYTIGDNVFILKMGEFEVSSETPKEDVAKMLFLKTGIRVEAQYIATSVQEVNESTKVYIGEWSVAVHNALPYTVEHIYSTSENRVENKIFRRTIELTTRTNEEYLQALSLAGMEIRNTAKYNILPMLIPLEKKESVDLVSFSVSDLGFPDDATLAEIYAKADELRFDLCDPHVGPEMRLAFRDQSPDSDYRIAMMPVFDADGFQRVWNVNHNGGELWLGGDNTLPGVRWNASYVFVFASRKK